MYEPILLSLVAGTATGIAGIFVISIGKISDRFIAGSMGFASGVMLLVSFLNLFSEALSMITFYSVSLAFAAGSILMIFIDLIIPHLEFGKKEDALLNSRLVRSGMLLVIGITLHNLPEGVIISAGYARFPKLGILLTIAIFFHNIPEGLATAVPLSLAGSKKRDIILATFLSGFAEPVGAILGLTFLSNASNTMIGLSLAFAAGVMTYITADELIPIAHEHGHKHAVSTGILLGIIFMLILNNFLKI